ncbi:hypothetical protein MUK42_12323, partial [Musa troglodytarum]
AARDRTFSSSPLVVVLYQSFLFLNLSGFSWFLRLGGISTGLSVSSGNGAAVAPEIASIGEAWRSAISSKIPSRLVFFSPFLNRLCWDFFPFLLESSLLASSSSLSFRCCCSIRFF